MPDSGSRLHAIVATALFLVTLLIVVGNVLPTRTRLAATQRALDEQHEQNRLLEARREALELEAHLLATDPWTNERILRDEFRMHRADELIVR